MPTPDVMYGASTRVGWAGESRKLVRCIPKGTDGQTPFQLKKKGDLQIISNVDK